MTDRPSPQQCPHCGSYDTSAGLAKAVHSCRDCGTRYWPAPSRAKCIVFAAAFIGPSLLSLAIAVVGLITVINAPPNGQGIAAGLVCLAIFGIGSVAGLWFGVRELRGRGAVVLVRPHDRLSDRPTPADRAVSVVRDVAEAHGAWHILKQLDGLRPDRVNNARRRFAREMTDEETPLLLVDSSFLQNGKAGFLLTSRAVYSSGLDRPVPLDGIESVVHRRPDRSISVVEVIVVFAHVIFPPLILLAIPLALRNRDRRTNALVINGRVAYRGGKNLTWGFWVDVLQALAAEARRRDAETRVEVVEVFSSEHAAPLRTTAPTWNTIEGVIRSLNGTTLCGARFWTGSPNESVGLEVIGGMGGYVLRQLGGSWTYYDRSAPDEQIDVGVGEQFPAYSVCGDMGRVIEIARGFAETGAFD
jgi:hypothetical protein